MGIFAIDHLTRKLPSAEEFELSLLLREAVQTQGVKTIVVPFKCLKTILIFSSTLQAYKKYLFPLKYMN